MDAASKINNFIEELLKTRTRLVLGIDGYSGIGKTTLSEKIAEMNEDILIIHMDDYAVTANTKEKLVPQIIANTNGLSLQWAYVKEEGLNALREEIANFRRSKSDKRVLIVEGIFLSHPNVLEGCFDKVVYLDGDEKEADERRIKREKERWGSQYFPESHPDSFARLFKLAWEKYKELYRPREHADLVVSI